MSLRTSVTYTPVTLTATGFDDVVTVSASLTEKLNQVTLNIPEVSGTSDADTFTLTGLPEWAWPSVELNLPIALVSDSGGGDSAGFAVVSTDGVISFGRYYNGSPQYTWTDSGTKTASASSFTWLI